MQITDKGINAGSTGTDQWLIESLGRGAGAFIGRVSPSGTRSFYFRYSDADGRQVRLLIDRYDASGIKGTTVAKARKLAGEWSALYKGEGGTQPGIRDLRGYFAQIAADKQASARSAREQEHRDRLLAAEAAERADLEQQRRLTVRQVFDRWAATELSPHIGGDGKRIGRKDGGQYVRDQFQRRVFSNLGDVAMVEVRKADILAVLDAAKAEGKLRTANTLLADLKQMFRFAAEREIIEHSPIELVSKRKVGGKDVKRNRVLSLAELDALARQLPEAKLTKRAEFAIWIILATGCRIGELTGAAWADSKLDQATLEEIVVAQNTALKSGGVHLGFVDLTTRTWHLLTTKNQRQHTIHLSDFSLQQFKELLALRPSDPKTGKPVAWVFPNGKGTGTGKGKGPVCVKSLGKQLADRQRTAEARMENRSKLVGALSLPGGRWTAHDLRRTTSTVMSQLGISNDVINECQNHIKEGMSGVYIQDRRESEQARAFDALGAKLQQIVTGEPAAGNVISLRAA